MELLIVGIVVLLFGAIALWFSFSVTRPDSADKKVARDLFRAPRAGTREEEAVPLLAPQVVVIDHLRSQLQENTIRRNVVFWSKPCLDSAAYYEDCRGTLDEIRSLRDMRDIDDLRMAVKASGKGPVLLFDKTVPGLTPHSVDMILRKFWAPHMGGFRQRRDLWVSTSASASAVDVAYKLADYNGGFFDPHHALSSMKDHFPDWVKGSRQLVLSNMNPESGMVSDILGEVPSVSSSHAGWMILRDLQIARETFENLGLCDGFIRNLRRHLQSGSLSDGTPWQAFCDLPGDEPSICATHHALACIAATGHQTDILYALGLEKQETLLHFAQLCRKGGGFAARRTSEEPTIAHTRYALALYRSLVGYPGFEDQAGKLFQILEIQPAEILGFLASMWTPPLGFRLSHSSSPCLYAIRAALLTVKYIELFRLNSFFIADSTYFAERDRLLSSVMPVLDDTKCLATYYKPEQEAYAFPRLS